MRYNTTHALIAYSDDVYTALDQDINGEPTAQRMVRLSLAHLANKHDQHTDSFLDLGRDIHALLWRELSNNGISSDNISAWPQYISIVNNLPAAPEITINDAVVDEIASAYKGVERITLRHDGTLEADARHVFHLMPLLCRTQLSTIQL